MSRFNAWGFEHWLQGFFKSSNLQTCKTWKMNIMAWQATPLQFSGPKSWKHVRMRRGKQDIQNENTSFYWTTQKGKKHCKYSWKSKKGGFWGGEYCIYMRVYKVCSVLQTSRCKPCKYIKGRIDRWTAEDILFMLQAFRIPGGSTGSGYRPRSWTCFQRPSRSATERQAGLS